MNDSRLSCGVVVVRRCESGWATLMLRAFRHWDFPKGIRERGEEPLEAAQREVAEETGITELSFEWGDRYFETGPYSRGKIARYFIAETTCREVVLGPSPETGQPEHSEWRWVSFDEAYDLGSPRVRQIVQWARQVIGA
jgi:8-oxo-dGTP pyrophosphatase MutT (NUDIX family)